MLGAAEFTAGCSEKIQSDLIKASCVIQQNIPLDTVLCSSPKSQTNICSLNKMLTLEIQYSPSVFSLQSQQPSTSPQCLVYLRDCTEVICSLRTQNQVHNVSGISPSVSITSQSLCRYTATTYTECIYNFIFNIQGQKPDISESLKIFDISGLPLYDITTLIDL